MRCLLVHGNDGTAVAFGDSLVSAGDVVLAFRRVRDAQLKDVLNFDPDVIVVRGSRQREPARRLQDIALAAAFGTRAVVALMESQEYKARGRPCGRTTSYSRRTTAMSFGAL